MKNKKISRNDFFKKAAAYALTFSGTAALMKALIKPAFAATGRCQKCDYAFRIIDSETGYVTCYQIASAKQLSLKDRKDFYTASFHNTESSCPATAKFNLPGFVPRTDAPFPPVCSGLSPFGGVLGKKVTPGINHPDDRIYSCPNCGFAEFFILMSSAMPKMLLCGKCSSLIKY